MAKNNAILWIVGIAAVLLITGVFELPDFGGNGDDGIDDRYPSTMKTSITLNTGDKLASSATDANVSYFVFDDSGNYLKEGTTSSGTATFNVPAGISDYQILVYDDTSATAVLDYLPGGYIDDTDVFYDIIPLSTDGGDADKRAEQTINVNMLRESNTSLTSVVDPIDLNKNVTGSAGETTSFDLYMKSETSNAAVREPIIVVQGNTTVVEKVSFVGLTEGTCPDRLTVDYVGEQLWCFPTNENLLSSNGLRKYSGTVKIDDVTAASINDILTFHVSDTGIYREADYKTAGLSAFKYGAENPITNADIGAGDSGDIVLGFGG